MLSRDNEYYTYLMYLPHFALPLAASLMVIPLEQEIRNSKNVTDSNGMRVFFIVVRFSLKLADSKKNAFLTALL
jgi:hypothetical protein